MHTYVCAHVVLGLQSVCGAQRWSSTGPCSRVHQWKLWSPAPAWHGGYGPPQQRTWQHTHTHTENWKFTLRERKNCQLKVGRMWYLRQNSLLGHWHDIGWNILPYNLMEVSSVAFHSLMLDTQTHRKQWVIHRVHQYGITTTDWVDGCAWSYSMSLTKIR